MRRERIAAVGVMLVASAAPLAAQKSDRLVSDSASKFQIAFCNLKMSGKVGDGQKALKTGIEDKDKAKRMAALANAERILTEQVGAGGQGQSAAAWYYLGRAYLLQGDVTGADSAFDKTTQFSPDCEIDVNTYRQNAWAVLANAGIEKLRANEQDSALVLFRQASTIFDQLPHVFENMGVIYANAGQQDSAAFYFGKAAQIAEADTSLVENRNSATLNQAMTLQRMEKHAEAIPVLEKYLGWNPNDTEARRSLAWSYRQAAQAAKADSLEAAMVDEFSKMNLDSLATNDLMAVGVSMFNGKKYDEAIKVFEKLMARNGWSRDAVYNLANTYLATKQWDKLETTGRRLIEIEPLNEDAYRLTSQALRELKKQDELLKVAEAFVVLPVNVEVTTFTMGQQSSRWQATATGRKASDAAGKELKPAPVTITIEFLDDSGKVLGTQDVSIPALQEGAAHQVQAEVKAPGVTAWRYKKK